MQFAMSRLAYGMTRLIACSGTRTLRWDGIQGLRYFSFLPHKDFNQNFSPRKVHCRSFAMTHDTKEVARPQMDPRAEAILDFWLGPNFREHAPSHVDETKKKLWFAGSPDVDKEVKERFGDVIEAAADRRPPDWGHGYNALAAVILMDQLTRNMYRGIPKTYSLDDQALQLAKELLDSGEAKHFVPLQRVWLLMPYMHSERLDDQQAGVDAFKALAQECRALPGGGEPATSMVGDNVRYAEAHRDVIARWGRFPHRNAILGRAPTPEEAAGLAEGKIPKF